MSTHGESNSARVIYIKSFSTPESRKYILPFSLDIPAWERYRPQRDMPLLSSYKVPECVRSLVEDIALLDMISIRDVSIQSPSQFHLAIQVFFAQDWCKVHDAIVLAIE